MNSESSIDAKQMLDTLIRRELKVGDPSDPGAVARALMQRYRDVPRAQAIEGEARGMPFLLAPIQRGSDIVVQGATDGDLETARAAVRADLERLLTDNLGADIRPEIEGWQQAILPAIEEGVANARIGLDPFRRDVAFGVRRQLGEYARLARLVGVAFPPLSTAFRRLANSLDLVANVLLVLMGEAMSDVGFSGGRFLLQINYSELQARRDAVLQALRRIDGIGVLGGGDASTWPRGLRAHRQLGALLEAQGQGDLRALLSESELARTLDGLVQQAGGNSPRSLRSIGATSWAPLTRLRRFLNASAGATSPASHELVALQEALQLFIEGFAPAGGFRLLTVARPAVLNGGVRGNAINDGPAQRLTNLVIQRGQLAEIADSFLDCRCDQQGARQAQVVLDRVLFDLDRAIDHYCNGAGSLGLPETRASALGWWLSAILVATYDYNDLQISNGHWGVTTHNDTTDWRVLLMADDNLTRILRDANRTLLPLVPNNDTERVVLGPQWAKRDQADYIKQVKNNWPVRGADQPRPKAGDLLRGELRLGREAERGWIPLLAQMASTQREVDLLLGDESPLETLTNQVDAVLQAVSPRSSNTPSVDAPPPHFEVSLASLAKIAES